MEIRNPEQYHQTLEMALDWGKEHYPTASKQRHAAFANSVAYIRHGFNGGYGGPAVLEHLATYLANEGTLDAEDGISIQDVPIEGCYQQVARICYTQPLPDPIMQIALLCSESNACMDDDPQFLAELQAFRTR